MFTSEEVIDNGTIFEFRADNTFTIDAPDNDDDDSGTWELTGNSLVLTDGSDEISVTINNLSDSELVLYLEEIEPADPDSGTDEVIVGFTFSFTRQ